MFIVIACFPKLSYQAVSIHNQKIEDEEEAKSIIHNFQRAFIEVNKIDFFRMWESDSK